MLWNLDAPCTLDVRKLDPPLFWTHCSGFVLLAFKFIWTTSYQKHLYSYWDQHDSSFSSHTQNCVFRLRLCQSKHRVSSTWGKQVLCYCHHYGKAYWVWMEVRHSSLCCSHFSLVCNSSYFADVKHWHLSKQRKSIARGKYTIRSWRCI